MTLIDDARATATARTGQELLDLQRAAHRRDGTPDAETRIERLDRLEAMLVAYADRLAAALSEDFGTRPAELSVSTEPIQDATATS